jgi:hypothetical protein
MLRPTAQAFQRRGHRLQGLGLLPHRLQGIVFVWLFEQWLVDVWLVGILFEQ